MKNKPIKILIVDDDEDDFFIMKKYISKIEGYEFIVDSCYTYREAEEKISNSGYDLYFVDYLLGAKTGLQLIQESVANNCEEPFILLTGNGSHSIDMKAMESGAVDYLAKGELNVEKLERCIRYSLERANSTKALKASEQKFRNIFERSKDIVFIADERLLITEVNNASSSLLGYNRLELLSKNLYSLLINEADAIYIREQLQSGNDILDKEMELLTKATERKYCIVTLCRENDSKGEQYIQGIIHDISSLKNSEKATLLLEKQAVANRLVKILAHEVRNPLTNILLSADQLSQFAGDDGSKFSEIIDRNGKRIQHLISQLLNSYKKTEIFIEKRSLQSIIDESLQAAIDRISLRNIQLQKDYPAEDAWVMADSEKLKIAFLNIIINSIEAMEDHTGKLYICIKKMESKYMVTIQDNGCGISEENIPSLFEPYFTSKPQGVGLGLSAVLNILQSHNTTIDVRSKLNEGTIFELGFMMA